MKLEDMEIEELRELATRQEVEVQKARQQAETLEAERDQLTATVDELQRRAGVRIFADAEKAASVTVDTPEFSALAARYGTSKAGKDYMALVVAADAHTAAVAAKAVGTLQVAYDSALAELRNITSHEGFAALGIVPAAFQIASAPASAPQQHAQIDRHWVMTTPENGNKIVIWDAEEAARFAAMDGRAVFEFVPAQQHAQAAQQFDFATLLMYPQEWDVAAYPTIESAMWEMISCAKIVSAIEHERNACAEAKDAALASQASKGAGDYGLMLKIAVLRDGLLAAKESLLLIHGTDRLPRARNLARVAALEIGNVISRANGIATPSPAQAQPVADAAPRRFNWTRDGMEHAADGAYCYAGEAQRSASQPDSERDAARYRWLCSGHGLCDSIENKHIADANIDATMAAQQGEKGW